MCVVTTFVCCYNLLCVVPTLRGRLCVCLAMEETCPIAGAGRVFVTGHSCGLTLCIWETPLRQAYKYHTVQMVMRLWAYLGGRGAERECINWQHRCGVFSRAAILLPNSTLSRCHLQANMP
jgi:hypothetical protein